MTVRCEALKVHLEETILEYECIKILPLQGVAWASSNCISQHAIVSVL